MKKSTLVFTLLFLVSSTSFAGLNAMNKSEVKKAIEDKTITTVPVVTLNNKNVNNTFTGYFSKDGKMTGSFSSAPSSGPQTDQGTWKIDANGKLCFTWQHWDDNKERCVAFYRLKNAILVTGPNNSFETAILDDNIHSGNQLSSQM